MVEILMLIMGIRILFTGKYKVGRKKVATGGSANLIAFLYILPAPLFFLIGFIVEAANPGSVNADLYQKWFVVEVAFSMCCFILGWLIALATAKDASSLRPGNRRSFSAAAIDFPPHHPNIPLAGAQQTEQRMTPLTFQFTCPQGHLLEGDPTHAGMQSQCPTCGSMFIIPQPTATPGPESDGAAAANPAQLPAISAGAGPKEQEFPKLNVGPADPLAGDPAPVEAPNLDPTQDDPDRVIHIICPNGHELETPMSMVGDDAMCPHCSAQFRLRFEDSLEHKEEKKKEALRRETAFERGALKWAIALAVLVGVGIIGLVIASQMR